MWFKFAKTETASLRISLILTMAHRLQEQKTDPIRLQVMETDQNSQHYYTTQPVLLIWYRGLHRVSRIAL